MLQTTTLGPVMSASVPQSTRIDGRGSLALEFGVLVGLATLGALACTLPATLRVSPSLAGMGAVVRAWSALVAAALMPMGLSVAALRGAWRAWRELGEEVSAVGVFGVGLWAAGLFVWMALLGAFLGATTHHHALAGVTYAFSSLGLAAGWGLVCWRTAAILRGSGQRGRRLAMASLGALLFAVVLLIGVRLLLVASRDPSSAVAVATVIDVVAFAFAALFASADWRFPWRPLAILGPSLALFLGALGLTTLGDPPVSQAIREQAPAYAPMAGLLSGR
jgi:hypothetical protein